MKRLSDYKGDEAFDLLFDLLDPISVILADKGIENILKQSEGSNEENILKQSEGSNKIIEVSKYILKMHKKEATRVMKVIDDSIEITPVSIFRSMVYLITDIQNDPSIKDFFKSAEQEDAASVVSGSAMGNIGENEQ